jgi:hypothetical protein
MKLKKYLSSGLQTQVTPEINKIASEISGTVLEKAQNILNSGSSLVKFQDCNKEEVFRKRTASQILQDGYITGCTDAALLFITLARASGIPAKDVETIDKEWLKNGGDQIGGHIYSQIYDESRGWVWVDPMRRKIDSPPENRVVFKEGLDSWDIGINDSDSLNTKFEEFRKQWLLEDSK